METKRAVLAMCASNVRSQALESNETANIDEFRWITNEQRRLWDKSKNFRLQNGSLEFSLAFEMTQESKTNTLLRNLLISVEKDERNVFGQFIFNINGWIFCSFRFENYDSGDYFVCAHEESVYEKMKTENSEFFVDVKWEQTERKSTTLSENLNSLLQSGELSDTVIRTQNESQLSVHKSILSARSPVFLAMFNSGMFEARNNCIKITDLLPDTVKTLIEYIYTERLPELTYDSATELLKASEKYDTPCLKQSCIQYLLQQLNICNALDLWSTMDTYRECEAKERVLNYIVRNPSYFSESESFDLVEDPNLREEILRALRK